MHSREAFSSSKNSNNKNSSIVSEKNPWQKVAEEAAPLVRGEFIEKQNPRAMTNLEAVHNEEIDIVSKNSDVMGYNIDSKMMTWPAARKDALGLKSSGDASKLAEKYGRPEGQVLLSANEELAKDRLLDETLAKLPDGMRFRLNPYSPMSAFSIANATKIDEYGRKDIHIDEAAMSQVRKIKEKAGDTDLTVVMSQLHTNKNGELTSNIPKSSSDYIALCKNFVNQSGYAEQNGKGLTLEIGNECNMGHDSSEIFQSEAFAETVEPKAYAKLYFDTAKALKTDFPDIKLSLSGTAFYDYDFTKEVVDQVQALKAQDETLEDKKLIDVISFHPYRNAVDEPTDFRSNGRQLSRSEIEDKAVSRWSSLDDDKKADMRAKVYDRMTNEQKDKVLSLSDKDKEEFFAFGSYASFDYQLESLRGLANQIGAEVNVGEVSFYPDRWADAIDETEQRKNAINGREKGYTSFVWPGEQILRFDSQEKQQDQSAEQSSDSKKSDDYIYGPDGLEYRNINKIDISTDQGKYEWLDGLLENGTTSQQAKIERLQYEGFDNADDEMIEAKTRLRSTERQQKILMNEVSLNEGDNILDMLRKKYTEYATRLNDITSNGSATEQAIDSAYEGYSAISNLLSLMESETTRRDPNYFGEKEIASLLENNVAEASKIAESTYVDQVFGEDGYVHKLPEGEKMPTTATEDAEIDLRNAKQEAETFGQIFNSYNEALDYQAPPAIKKADFSPKIIEYIDGHTAEINRLLQESRTIPKDSPEYAENSASRRKLASERSAARRLMAKYFVASESSTNNSNTEAGAGETVINEPEEKTKPEAPIEDTTANNPPMSYHFESGLVDGEATVTVGQEIPDEWLRPRIYGENTPVTINRPPLVEDYLMQALNIEFNKLSEDARKNYSYADIAKAIEEEVVRTKRFPDIPAIFKHDTSDDGIKMEEMPAGKSEEQIERENTSRVKIDNGMQARMEAYWAEKRANEQKQREEQERVQKEQEDEMEMEM